VKIEIPPFALCNKSPKSNHHPRPAPPLQSSVTPSGPLHPRQARRSIDTMDGPSRIPGFYPETPAPSRYPASSSMGLNGTANLSPSNNLLGSIGRGGGPIRRTPAAAISRARAHSTPYARPAAQSTPGSGSRPRRDDDDDDEVLLHSLRVLMVGFD
jgi:hypothetical protein